MPEVLRTLKTKVVAYLGSAQSKRDALCLVLFVLAAVGYEHFLRQYLKSSPAQLQLSLGFTGSLLFAMWYEFKWEDLRGSLIRMTTITIVFMGGAYLAPYVRAEFFELVAEVRNKPKAIEMFTSEGLALLSNPMAGYGGCLGLSVMAARLLGWRVVIRLLSRVMTHDANSHTCPHCLKPIPR